MKYRKFGNTYYVRMDKDDEMISIILDICKKENIKSATFNGIGGCKTAEIQTFIPQQGAFKTEKLEGMLELVSFMGNIVTDDEGNLHHHTHALYSYVKNEKHFVLSGHIKSSTVLYTAEIELRPVTGGSIGYKKDAETGTGFWNL